MKKVFFSFAVVAVAAIALAACGNKSANNAEQAEASEEQQVEAPAEAGATAECDNFTVSVPAGLKYNENGSSSTSITLDAPDYGQFESITLYVNKEETSASKLRDQYYGDGADKEKAADVKIAGKDFAQLYYVDSSDNNSDLFAEVEGGVLVVSLSKNVPVEAEVLTPLIESFKQK